jgi:serine protease Do
MRRLWPVLISLLLVFTSWVVSAQTIGTIEKNITDLVDKTSQSIVSIAAVSAKAPGLTGSRADALRPTAKSIGCGIVYERDGLILTTTSVVGYARVVDVGTRDGAFYKGVVIGTDPASDLAIVKVEDGDLTPATFGGSAAILPGSWVLVLGNAFGSLPSVSMGVASSVPSARDKAGEQMLRLCVPINPGDIGGPVVNTKGEVIGIVVGRLSFQPRSYSVRWGSGGAFGFGGPVQPSNMSVALPAVRALEIAREVQEKGGKERGFLGVQVMELSDEIRQKMGSRDLEGAVVIDVVPGSPAESVGMVPWDVIMTFDSQGIASVASLRDLVEGKKPGDVVDITYLRGTKTVDENVRIAPFVQEYLRRTYPAEEVLNAEEVGARIRDLKSQIERLQRQLERLEEKR